LEVACADWDDPGGVRLLHESIVARGSGRPTPIIYTIQLDTIAEHRLHALEIFNALIDSFHVMPVPHPVP